MLAVPRRSGAQRLAREGPKVEAFSIWFAELQVLAGSPVRAP